MSKDEPPPMIVRKESRPLQIAPAQSSPIWPLSSTRRMSARVRVRLPRPPPPRRHVSFLSATTPPQCRHPGGHERAARQIVLVEDVLRDRIGRPIKPAVGFNIGLRKSFKQPWRRSPHLDTVDGNGDNDPRPDVSAPPGASSAPKGPAQAEVRMIHRTDSVNRGSQRRSISAPCRA